MRHRLLIAREQYKFSCAHMTVFPDGTKERLHGHNYQLGAAIEVSDVALANMIPFAPIKAALAQVCEAWKERVLLAELCPQLEIVSRDDREVEIRLCGDRYVFPARDALFVPVDNITVEALATHVCQLLRDRLAGVLAAPHVLALEVTVSESPGQGSTCAMSLR